MSNNLEDLKETENAEIDEIKENKINKTILVLSGGGIKGICQLGVLQTLKDNNLLNHITTYAGTSIGSYICALLNIGYSPEELLQIILDLDTSKLIKKEDKYCNLFCEYGIDDGTKFGNVLNMLFEFKNINKDITMKELYEMTNKTLYIATTCLNTKQIVYISHDNFPDLSVILAVRMSCCIPLYFCPIIYNNYYYIDGGGLDNYPIHLFNDRLEEVIGIYVKDDMSDIEDITDIKKYLLSIMKTVFIGVHNKNIRGYENNTYLVNVTGVNIMNLNLSEEQKLELYNLGKNVNVKL